MLRHLLKLSNLRSLNLKFALDYKSIESVNTAVSHLMRLQIEDLKVSEEITSKLKEHLNP